MTGFGSLITPPQWLHFAPWLIIRSPSNNHLITNPETWDLLLIQILPYFPAIIEVLQEKLIVQRITSVTGR
jgi:hypothetical protein